MRDCVTGALNPAIEADVEALKNALYHHVAEERRSMLRKLSAKMGINKLKRKKMDIEKRVV